MKLIFLLWQGPLAFVSWTSYRFFRWKIHRQSTAVDPPSLFKKTPLWQGLSTILNRPGGVAYAMATGPRWNCHAVIGILRNLQVQETISIHLPSLYQSASQWTLVIYGQSYQTHTHLSSLDADSSVWKNLSLPSGSYHFILRYYQPTPSIQFPEIQVDHTTSVPSQPIPDEADTYQTFLQQLSLKNQVFYSWIQLHVFYCLRWKNLLPPQWIHSLYLPVGNPETNFYYGFFEQGTILKWNIPSELFSAAILYVTYYNIASFPIYWNLVLPENQFSPRLYFNGYYLMRVHWKIQEKESFMPLLPQSLIPEKI